MFVAVLTACGGGGGGSTSTPVPVASTASFPYESGFKARVANGSSVTYNVSGYCSGTASDVRGAPVSGTFEGSPALAVTATQVNSVSSPCTSVTLNGTRYYDTNYVPRGYNIPAGSYGVFVSPPVIPISVKIGDTGAIGTQYLYTDSTKAVYMGKQLFTYIVEADSATTAIVNVVDKLYTSTNVLSMTTQDRMRIATNGTLTPISHDMQDAQGNSLHFVAQ